MVSFTSELLCFYVLEAIVHKITMTRTSFEKKDGFFLSFPFLNKKRKDRPHSFMVCNLNIHCKEFQLTREQRGSELQGSTYTRSFVNSKHYSTTQSTVG